MRVALVHLPSWVPKSPPLGLSYIATALKEDGHSVISLDYNALIFSKTKADNRRYWKEGNTWQWAQEDTYRSLMAPLIEPYALHLVRELVKHGAEAVGFTVFLSSHRPVLDFAAKIREMLPGIKIFYGGPQIDLAVARKDIGARLIDAAVIGEGEVSARELLRFWDQHKDSVSPAPRLPGVVHVDAAGMVRYDGPRDLMKVDMIGVPDFSDYPFDENVTLPVSFARGCVNKCNYCSETAFWKTFRLRSVESVMSELKAHIQNYGVRRFSVNDSLVNGYHKRLEEIADAIIAEKLNIQWQGNAIIDQRLTPELLQKLHRAGCRELAFGLETGSKRVLKLMNKRINVDMTGALRVLQQAARARIRVQINLIVGFPNETWIDFMKTFFMVFRLGKTISFASLNTLEVQPNAKLGSESEKHGLQGTGKGWSTLNGNNSPSIREFKRRIILWLLKRHRVWVLQEDTLA